MNYLEKANGIFDDVAKVHSYARGELAVLPPSDATQLVQELLDLAGPMLQDLREKYPVAMQAVEAQRQETLEIIAEAQSLGDQAKAQLDQVKPPEEIALGFIPAPVPIPQGLTSGYAAEMLARYAPPPVAAPESDLPPAAWQDWTIA